MFLDTIHKNINGSGSVDPDPHKSATDPQHWYLDISIVTVHHNICTGDSQKKVLLQVLQIHLKGMKHEISCPGFVIQTFCFLSSNLPRKSPALYNKYRAGRIANSNR